MATASPHDKTFHGTHRGPFFGIPAAGRRVSIANGQIAEHWNVVDVGGGQPGVS
jgi:predicted ester cyclase